MDYPKSKSGEKTYSLSAWRKYALCTGNSELGLLVSEYDTASQNRTAAKQIAKLGQDRIDAMHSKIQEIENDILNSDANIATAEAAQRLAKDALKNAVDDLV